VASLQASGGGRLVAITCVGGAGQRLMPCGRCRQLLWENGGPELLVDTPAGAVRLADLLPSAFDAADLPVIILREPRNDHAHHPCLKITRLPSLAI
jgi:cytidine deaminase